MTKAELIAEIDMDGELDYALGEDCIYVRWLGADDCISVAESALPALDFATIRKAAVNGRDVRHMTRIVGYFSNTKNWNQSKIGELKDRHKGDYGVSVT